MPEHKQKELEPEGESCATSFSPGARGPDRALWRSPSPDPDRRVLIGARVMGGRRRDLWDLIRRAAP